MVAPVRTFFLPAVICGVFWGWAGANLSPAAEGDQGSPSAPDRMNYFLCTQAIGGPYRFTDQPYLLEVARRIAAMGSNFIKFTTSFEGKPYGMKKIEGIETLVDLFEKHPVYREVMTLPFTYYHLWVYPAWETKWEDGVDAGEEKKLYAEFRAFAEYLLKKYDGTGKQFYLGHWEGDWTMSGATDPKVDATPERIRGFTQYLQIRQRAIEDARREVPHRDVAVYHYVEVNQVLKGLDGKRPTVTNAVLAEVNPDFVSYSCYEAIYWGDPRKKIPLAFSEVESRLKPRPEISGKRVFAGEFAVKASAVDFDGKAHARKNLEVARILLEWGCPFAVYWQFYCNEPNEKKSEGYEGFWLVDSKNRETQLYSDFVRYFREMRDWSNRQKEVGKKIGHEEVKAEAIQLIQKLQVNESN